MIQLPWQRPELEGWFIVGMNHYRIDGQWQIFVAMAKDGQCIKVEGPDAPVVWDKLAAKAAGHQKGG